ncbi:MAG: Methionine-binding lipoprotein MetQ [Chlamydiae bacterium]|nr:Methionine-binding lipoprotein MetQ [Chlamydiota bacterium]
MKKWILVLVLAFGCAKKEEDKNTLKIAASPVPHAQILEFVKPILKDQGINLKIIEVDDYNIPNRSLAEKEVDANFFQHAPFMEQQIKAFGYKIQCYASIHLEPMAIYSEKLKSIDEIPNGGIIALPNDPTNEYRALAILQKKGLIKLREGATLQATKADIQSNPKNLKFQEIDAAMLPRTLRDVDAAAIPTNYALQGGLNPSRDALAMESVDSPYANILTIRDGDDKDPRLEALRKELLSDKMRAFILEKYQGAVIPVLTDCR